MVARVLLALVSSSIVVAGCGAGSSASSDVVLASVSSPTASAPAPREDERTCTSANDAEGPNVRRVLVRGTTWRDACVAVRTMAGRAPDSLAVEADIKALYATGRFEDVTVVEESGDLVFELRERPPVTAFEVVAPSDPEATAAVAGILERPERFDPAWLHLRSGDVVAALRGQGYLDAAMQYEASRREGGTMAIRVVVVEGPRVVVGDVAFEGLKASKPARILPELVATKGAPASDLALQRDHLMVSSVLHDEGLIESAVEQRATRSADRKSVSIVYAVKEGPVYKLGKVAIEGNSKHKDALYAAALSPLKKGATFDRSKVAGARDAMQRLHDDPATSAMVDVETEVDAKKLLVHVTFRVSP